MSKIGKKPITLPSGVDVTVSGSEITVKGPKGELKRTISEAVGVMVADGKVTVTLKNLPAQAGPNKQDFPTWGLERALVNNMIKGVSEGFTETLELNGVGYKAVPKGNDLELSLGYSHTITFKTPAGISFKVEKNVITITGIDKELVGYVAAQIRKMKVPDPYKVHGVKYADEVIKTKAGKKAAAA